MSEHKGCLTSEPNLRSESNSISESNTQTAKDQILNTNEELLANTVIIGDNMMINLVDRDYKVRRTIGISNDQKKSYYFMTNHLQPGCVKCNTITKTSNC